MEGFVGRVINGAFAVWGRNILSFSVLAVVINLPVVGVQYVMVDGIMAGDPSFVYRFWGVSFGLSLIFGSLLSAALTWGVLQDLRQERASLGDCLSKGFSRMGAVLVVSLVTALAVAFSGLALIIPGIIVSLMLYVAVPVVVMEEVDPMEALRRSSQLTDGAKRALFYAVIGIGIVTWVLSSIAGIAVGTLVTNPVNAVLAGELVGSFFMPLGASAAAVAYFLLRQEREGVHLDELASIFD